MISPIVSVIIPVYNSEKYLKKCLKSVINQTYTNIEIIIVDDGSKDGSLSICDSFARKDSRITIIHKANGGVSSARNTGIGKANGKYISFVDSDDWLPKNAIEALVSGIESDGSDFCYGEMQLITATHMIKLDSLSSSTYDLVLPNISHLRTEISFGPWAKLYKTQILHDFNLRYDETIKYAEDRIFMWKYLQKISKVSSVAKVVYYYNRMVLNSASGKYYPLMHEWLFTDLYEFDKIFAGNKDKAAHIYLNQVAWELFDFSCMHHEKSSNATDEFIINKLKDSYNIFKDYLGTTTALEISRVYSPYLSNENFEKIHCRLKQISVKQTEKVMQTIVRKFIIKVKELFLFKLFP